MPDSNRDADSTQPPTGSDSTTEHTQHRTAEATSEQSASSSTEQKTQVSAATSSQSVKPAVQETPAQNHDEGTKRTVPGTTDTYYNTGFQKLDEFLGEGLPAGSLTTLLLPPSAAGSLFVTKFASLDRATEYISTIRYPSQIREDLVAVGAEGRRRTTQKNYLRYAKVRWLKPDEYNWEEPLSGELGHACLRLMNEGGGVLVFEAANPVLEHADVDTWRTVCNHLQGNLRRSGSVGLMVLLREPGEPGRVLIRSERSLLHRSDAVLEYRRVDEANSNDTDELVVRKVRGLHEDALQTGDNEHLPATIPLLVQDTLTHKPGGTI